MSSVRQSGLGCESINPEQGDTVGRILVHEFISLDGVNENPSWTQDYPFDPKMGQTIAGMMGPGTAILLGRRTYEMFYPVWSKRTAEEDPGAPFFNESQKYVVSGTLPSAEWQNSSIVGPYSAEGIRSLKESVEGDLYVSGSTTLVRAMLADGLVDELHLFTFPVVLGSGERLFADGGPPIKLGLVATDAYDSGVVHLAYRGG
jgi:dihydrofolate reductase